MLTGEELLLLSDRLAPCPECGDVVVACDNDYRLDLDPDPDGLWGLMNVAGVVLACSAPDDDQGSHHNLHEHQPEGLAE